MSTYVLRGAVPLSSVAYVPRNFEREVVGHVFADRWVLVLGPRQHGKTSGLIRISRDLRGAGYSCAKVDLQSQPLFDSYAEFLSWFASEVARELETGIGDAPEGILSRSVESWLLAAVPSGSEPVVVMVDEASAVGDMRWLENFYGQLRSIANKRAESVLGELPRRLIFVFSGTFLPEYLIANTQNSPFNVCEKVYTEDLSLQDTISLQEQVEGFSQQTLLARIYERVKGHPYLTQVILNALRPMEPEARIQKLDDTISSCLDSVSEHFANIYGRLGDDPSLVEIVDRIVVEAAVDIDPADNRYRYLQVIGLASVQGSQLLFRNAAYQQVGRRNLETRRACSPIRTEGEDGKVSAGGRASQPATGRENMAGSGDTFTFSGDLRGAIININSTISDAVQIVQRMPDASRGYKNELEGLLRQLNEALEQVLPEKEEEAEAVAEYAKELVETATGEQPNKFKIKISAENLKKAAENLAEIAAPVLLIATQIADAILKYAG